MAVRGDQPAKSEALRPQAGMNERAVASTRALMPAGQERASTAADSRSSSAAEGGGTMQSHPAAEAEAEASPPLLPFAAYAVQKNEIPGLDTSRYHLLASAFLYRYADHLPQDLVPRLMELLYQDLQSRLRAADSRSTSPASASLHPVPLPLDAAPPASSAAHGAVSPCHQHDHNTTPPIVRGTNHQLVDALRRLNLLQIERRRTTPAAPPQTFPSSRRICRTRLYTRILGQLRQAGHAYFAQHWDNLPALYKVNRPAFLSFRHTCEVQQLHAVDLPLHEEPEPKAQPTSHEAPAKRPRPATFMSRADREAWSAHVWCLESYAALETLIGQADRVLIMFTADYCRFCRLLRPAINQVADQLHAQDVSAAVACVYGPDHLDLRDRFHIRVYPTLLLFINGELRAAYPRAAERSPEKIKDFVLNTPANADESVGLHAPPLSLPQPADTTSGSSDVDLARSPQSGDANLSRTTSQPQDGTSASSLNSWREALISAGIDLIDDLERARELAVARETSKVDDAEACQGGVCPARSSDEPPTIFFTGGGIASGKSSGLKLLYASDFWRQHAAQVVQIEADRLKTLDPLFQALKGVGAAEASAVVHQSSTSAAEDLLVKAVNARRHIVFDSTMMWAPFVHQTLDMIADQHHDYVKGPGYVTQADGSSIEQYWVRGPETTCKSKYRCVLLAMTVEPALAIKRAVVRWIVSGRAPSSTRRILSSHRWFSEAFPNYAARFDQVLLLDADPHASLMAQQTQCGPKLADDSNTEDSQLDSQSLTQKDERLDLNRDQRTALIPVLQGARMHDRAAVVYRRVAGQAHCCDRLYARFRHKRYLNLDATCEASMFPAQDPECNEPHHCKHLEELL
ncbi:uncharacterized protein MONBRDRAFT_34089 [Monosiga brevicollis MX1]|uniref:Thioredoxin domain-containing protein n=1 Tax=Monosiga brevicollis TaxID=81824 RepID=A9V9E1_MONBE|nr:uncharacterized protein MONBRDRAFT_34089 [Monosiga brevicollis MX1]EDQ85845.1 predicted protein [Monosiga brevicollis MX1]|eukprot:XP_001749324.1 hypothetical protein [Monosiga brevicollis MX1]